MDVYLYRAALYCKDCGEAIKAELGFSHEGMSECDYDSDDYPKGPFPNGGGEADCPQHCDACGEFLCNPLTGDGEAYVMETMYNWNGAHTAIVDWMSHYSYLVDRFLNEQGWGDDCDD
jgi:hypothetical protein